MCVNVKEQVFCVIWICDISCALLPPAFETNQLSVALLFTKERNLSDEMGVEPSSGGSE